MPLEKEMNSPDVKSASIPVVPKNSEPVRRTLLETESMHRQSCGRTVGKLSIKILSAIFIPLCIGVFTIVSTLQQTTIAENNRLKDLHIANETRHVDQKIADDQRDQELLLAAESRNKDRDLASENRRESVLNEYVRNIADLLLTKNHSLSIRIKEHVIRPKTLTALRQLDNHRKGLLILFLYESKLLIREENPIDLSRGDLNSIVFPHQLGPRLRFHRLSLVGVLLHNASFRNCEIFESDFTLADLVAADFSNSKVLATDFDQSNLAFSNFNQADVFASNFRQANITETQFVTNRILAENQFSLFNAIVNKTLLKDQQNYMDMTDDCIFPKNWEVQGVTLRRYDGDHLPTEFRQGPCYYYSAVAGNYISSTFNLERNHYTFIQAFPTVIEVFIDSIHSGHELTGTRSPLFVHFTFYNSTSSIGMDK